MDPEFLTKIQEQILQQGELNLMLSIIVGSLAYIFGVITILIYLFREKFQFFFAMVTAITFLFFIALLADGVESKIYPELYVFQKIEKISKNQRISQYTVPYTSPKSK